MLGATSPRNSVRERALVDVGLGSPFASPPSKRAEILRAEASAAETARVAAEEDKAKKRDEILRAEASAAETARVAAEEDKARKRDEVLRAEASAAEAARVVAEEDKVRNLAAKAQAAIAAAAAAKGPAAPASDDEDDLPLSVSCKDPATAAREQASKMLDTMEKRDPAPRGSVGVAVARSSGRSLACIADARLHV